MFIELGYLGLFIASFLSSTIIPMGSEFILIALIANGFNPYYCILIATIGNTLGGITSYGIGYLGKWEWIEKWFKVTPEKIERHAEKIKRWGPWFALLTWLPGVGDIIAIGLGFFVLLFNPILSISSFIFLIE